MIGQQLSVNTPLGVQIENHDVRVKIRGGSTVNKGSVVQLDLAQADAASTSYKMGDASSGLVNAILPAAAGTKGQRVLAVMLETVVDDGEGMARVYGIVDEAYVIAASGSVAKGDPLVPTTAGDLDLVPAAGEAYVAIALEAATTPTTHVLKKVLFDGRGASFGNYYAS